MSIPCGYIHIHLIIYLSLNILMLLVTHGYSGIFTLSVANVVWRGNICFLVFLVWPSVVLAKLLRDRVGSPSTEPA